MAPGGQHLLSAYRHQRVLTLTAAESVAHGHTHAVCYCKHLHQHHRTMHADPCVANVSMCNLSVIQWQYSRCLRLS